MLFLTDRWSEGQGKNMLRGQDTEWRSFFLRGKLLSLFVLLLFFLLSRNWMRNSHIPLLTQLACVSTSIYVWESDMWTVESPHIFLQTHTHTCTRKAELCCLWGMVVKVMYYRPISLSIISARTLKTISFNQSQFPTALANNMIGCCGWATEPSHTVGFTVYK